MNKAIGPCVLLGDRVKKLHVSLFSTCYALLPFLSCERLSIVLRWESPEVFSLNSTLRICKIHANIHQNENYYNNISFDKPYYKGKMFFIN